MTSGGDHRDRRPCGVDNDFDGNAADEQSINFARSGGFRRQLSGRVQRLPGPGHIPLAEQIGGSGAPPVHVRRLVRIPHTGVGGIEVQGRLGRPRGGESLDKLRRRGGDAMLTIEKHPQGKGERDIGMVRRAARAYAMLLLSQSDNMGTADAVSSKAVATVAMAEALDGPGDRRKDEKEKGHDRSLESIAGQAQASGPARIECV